MIFSHFNEYDVNIDLTKHTILSLLYFFFQLFQLLFFNFKIDTSFCDIFICNKANEV